MEPTSFLRTALVCALLLLPLATPPSASAELSLTRSSHSIIVDGVTPGERVILFGVGRDEHGPAPRLYHALFDSDGDGRVLLPLQSALPPTLVVGALEFHSGRAELAAWGWRPGRKWHDAASQSLELLWLRPGVAEWATRVTHHHLDTGPRGEVLSNLVPGIEAGDVVLAVDLSTMRPVLMRSPGSVKSSVGSDSVPSRGTVSPAAADESDRSVRPRP